MVEYLIGNFMVSSGLMSEFDFEKVIEIQDKARVKLGLIAVSEGMMTVKQADEVNFLQTVLDKRFGDIAISKGFLTEEQVEYLLNKQGNEYLAFMQTLVDQGIIGLEEVDAVAKGYQIENGFTDEQMEEFKKADVESIVDMYLPEGAEEYSKIARLMIKTVIRCIDRHASIGHAMLVDSYSAVMPVTQELLGDSGLTTGFADGDGGMCKAASVFGRLEMTELDEDVQDACGEVINCINGLYASMISKETKEELELLPPDFHDSFTIRSEDIFVMPVYIEHRRLDFIVLKNEWR